MASDSDDILARADAWLRCNAEGEPISAPANLVRDLAAALREARTPKYACPVCLDEGWLTDATPCDCELGQRFDHFQRRAERAEAALRDVRERAETSAKQDWRAREFWRERAERAELDATTFRASWMAECERLTRAEAALVACQAQLQMATTGDYQDVLRHKLVVAREYVRLYRQSYIMDCRGPDFDDSGVDAFLAGSEP